MLKKTFLFLLFVFSLSACTIKQEPIRFGTDSCDNCRMLIMDPKFGAVILTKKGKNFKFDDTNCLSSYLKTNFSDEQEIAGISVIDFNNPETLIDAKNAFYVSSPKIKSPMSSGIAAFSTQEAGSEFIGQHQGTSVTWDEIKAQFE